MQKIKQKKIAPLVAFALFVGAAPVWAAENNVQRYTAGLGGSDMTSMLSPGWYGQVALIHYHATRLRNNSGSPYAVPVGGGASLPVGKFRAEAYIALPRLSYISNKQFLGANVGFTAMLPVVTRNTSIGGTVSPAVNNLLATTKSGSTTGFGDLEFAPLLNWTIGENQTITFAPTIVVPTGKFDAKRPVNIGFGNYYTFRPSLQYGYIGDGWDVGMRGVLSFNSSNKDTGYDTGNLFNLDFAAMTFVSEDVRMGVQGYVVKQFTADRSKDVAEQAQIDFANGKKMQAVAIGPAVAWLINGGEMLIEGKAFKEFSARNRSEGMNYMLTISKPFGL